LRCWLRRQTVATRWTLISERDLIPARLDLLDIEPLELPGGPRLSDALNDVRDDRP
jgi:hypothetical protein